MELTYGQLEAVLVAHFRIHPDRIGTFQSRIKQLQRLEFPPGVNIGRGARMTYDAQHLLMLVTAFQLISAGFAAKAACKITIDHWETWAGAYALAAIRDRTWGEKQSDPVAVSLRVTALYDIQVVKAYLNRPSHLTIYDKAALSKILINQGGSEYSTNIFWISSTLEDVLSIASERAGVKYASSNNPVFNSWLPSDKTTNIYFVSRYPDRSNIAVRKQLHQMFGNDPDSLTPEGQEEAREFIENGYGDDPPF